MKQEVLDILNPPKQENKEEKEEKEEKEGNEEEEENQEGENNKKMKKKNGNYSDEESFNDLHISTDSEAEKNRVRIKHKKASIKYRLPMLRDTTPGAFEKFKEEQRLKRERNKEEERLEKIRIKKFFDEIKKLKKLDDDAFDEYIKEQMERFKKKERSKCK